MANLTLKDFEPEPEKRPSAYHTHGKPSPSDAQRGPLSKTAEFIRDHKLGTIIAAGFLAWGAYSLSRGDGEVGSGKTPVQHSDKGLRTYDRTHGGSLNVDPAQLPSQYAKALENVQDSIKP